MKGEEEVSEERVEVGRDVGAAYLKVAFVRLGGWVSWRGGLGRVWNTASCRPQRVGALLFRAKAWISNLSSCPQGTLMGLLPAFTLVALFSLRPFASERLFSPPSEPPPSQRPIEGIRCLARRKALPIESVKFFGFAEVS